MTIKLTPTQLTVLDLLNRGGIIYKGGRSLYIRTDDLTPVSIARPTLRCLENLLLVRNYMITERGIASLALGYVATQDTVNALKQRDETFALLDAIDNRLGRVTTKAIRAYIAALEAKIK